MDFYYYIAVWAVAYAEAINEGTYLPVPDVTEAKSVRDVLDILERENPDFSFNYGLGVEDLQHNARALQILERLSKVETRLRELDVAIRPTDKMTIRVGDHTPVKLGPYLRSFLRHLKPIPPNLRLGGSNGELTVLKFATGLTSVKTLAKVWLRNVKTKVEFLDGFELQIAHPSSRQNLPPGKLPNEKNILSGLSVAANLRGLTQVLLHHYKKKFLVPLDYAQNQFPSGFEDVVEKLPVRCHKVYRTFATIYETVVDIYLTQDDLEYLFAWDLLYDVLGDILNVLKFGVYDLDNILVDLQSHPDNLDELMRYYSPSLRSSPELSSFGDKIAFMDEWDIV